jgi:hypothetical protein
MSYPLRLPDYLDAPARARADQLGISLNALVCFALGAHLESLPMPLKPITPPATAPAVGAPDAPETVDKGGKKETFKERQRSRDTAFKPAKKEKP